MFPLFMFVSKNYTEANLLFKIVTKHIIHFYDVLAKLMSKRCFEIKNIKTNNTFCFYICIELQSIKINKSTGLRIFWIKLSNE